MAKMNNQSQPKTNGLRSIFDRNSLELQQATSYLLNNAILCNLDNNTIVFL